jgi:hypothetical protein
MDGLSIISVGFGILIRLAIPVAVTLVVAYVLRQLDQRWQQEASVGAPSPIEVLQCWVLNDCPPERREKCAAYHQQNIPCWQVFRDEAGRLPQRCLSCDVFRKAPVVEII